MFDGFSKVRQEQFEVLNKEQKRVLITIVFSSFYSPNLFILTFLGSKKTKKSIKYLKKTIYNMYSADKNYIFMKLKLLSYLSSQLKYEQ